MRLRRCFGVTLALLAGVWVASSIASEASSGRVVGVVDGDTLTVVVDGRQTTIRIADIDAPEKCQAHGVRAKEVLSELVMGRTVRVRITGKDGYGRSLANIETDDHAEVGAAMIDSGAAWVYRKYSQNAQLLKAEGSAQRFRVGLWGDQNPKPPWEWRAGSERCEQTKSTQRKSKTTPAYPSHSSIIRPGISTDAAARILAPMVERSEAEARAAAASAQFDGVYPRSSGTGPIRTGPRGGRYYVDGSGNKQYVEK